MGGQLWQGEGTATERVKVKDIVGNVVSAVGLGEGGRTMSCTFLLLKTWFFVGAGHKCLQQDNEVISLLSSSKLPSTLSVPPPQLFSSLLPEPREAEPEPEALQGRHKRRGEMENAQSTVLASYTSPPLSPPCFDEKFHP